MSDPETDASFYDDNEISPQTQIRHADIARWNDSRQEAILRLRATQVPESGEEIIGQSARMAAAADRLPRQARRSTAQERRSSPIAFIYLRVSTKEQARRGGTAEGYSIPTQRSGCHAKADQLGATVVAEYVDAGESARSSKRDDLQEMLREVKRVQPDYVIVHKIDRLARNREDDIAINVLLRRHGAKLVSCMENIDETPSGKLLYGLMAEIAQFYSSNLAEEVMKGLLAKAEEGGTPYRAPLGYRNRRETVDGFERAWVEVDPERVELVAWCFKQYATGEWTVADLTLEAQVMGLTTRPTPSKPSTPVPLTTMHHILQNPYFMGIVPYRGFHYEGSHPALVEPEMWLAVQDTLASHNHTGEKDRKHPHYLRTTIYCSACGGRLVYSQNTGNGGTYEYYFCVKKKTKANNCRRPAVRLERIEDGIANLYAQLKVPRAQIEEIRAAVTAELSTQREEAERGARRASKRKQQVDGERKKLLQAHYAGAIPADLLASEMQRFTQELGYADRMLQRAQATSKNLVATLNAALVAAEHCERAYLPALPHIKRQINQGLFKKLFIGEDGNVERAEMHEPFEALLGSQDASPISTEERLSLPAQGAVPVAHADECARLSVVLRTAFERSSLVERYERANTLPKMDLAAHGLKESLLVGAAGFEPATARV